MRDSRRHLQSSRSSIARFFTVPQFLTRKFGVQPHHIRISANVTLRFATFDIHHDDGIVISTLAGGAKLWVIYPPTAHNLLSLRRYYSDSDSLFEDSFPTFQDGILLLQRDSQTVYVPPNCLHFVFTLSSCILYGCEVTPPSVFSRRIKSCLVHCYRLALSHFLCVRTVCSCLSSPFFASVTFTAATAKMLIGPRSVIRGMKPILVDIDSERPAKPTLLRRTSMSWVKPVVNSALPSVQTQSEWEDDS